MWKFFFCTRNRTGQGRQFGKEEMAAISWRACHAAYNGAMESAIKHNVFKAAVFSKAVQRCARTFFLRFWMLCGLIFALAGTVHAQIDWLGSGLSSSHSLSMVSGSVQADTGHVRAELVAYVPQGIEPGRTFWVGVKLTHQPQWHTYWENPGDTGLATSLVWDIPPDMSAGDIVWPAPKPIPVAGGMVNYGYEGTVLLPVELTVAPEFSAEQIDVKVRADWLACRVECIPESADLTLRLPARQSTVSEPGLFETTFATLPQLWEGAQAEAWVRSDDQVQTGGVLVWEVTGLPPSMQGKALNLFLRQPGISVNTGPITGGWDGAVWRSVYALAPQRENTPQALDALVTLAKPEQSGPLEISADGTQAVWLSASVHGDWPSTLVNNAPVPEIWLAPAGGQNMPAAHSGGTGKSWLVALLLAFAGGLLLNLMPCVFPVLSIKALSFAQSGGHTRTLRIMTALAYTFGVLFAMLSLAGLLLVLRAGGMGLGWGFQLQSPVFVTLLAVLFLLIALNLIGVFQVGTMLPGAIGAVRGRTPALDAFFSGIISVLIASPCSAPFMGAALGVAVLLPAWQAMLVFAALALGLALPLALLTCVPTLAGWLPRPGQWMETFRRFMAFPMLATVLWLVWVIGLQTGADGAAALLAILLALAFWVWILGWAQQKRAVGTVRGRQKVWVNVAILLALMLLLGVVWWVRPALHEEPVFPSTAAGQAADAGTDEQASAGEWQPWSPHRVDELLAQGKPVFIDFTAAWCVTCQVNKRTTLHQPEVLEAFATHGVTPLVADWTRRDPMVAEALQSYARSGLPTYVLLSPGREPQLLPELLTPSTVIEALQSLPAR